MVARVAQPPHIRADHPLLIARVFAAAVQGMHRVFIPFDAVIPTDAADMSSARGDCGVAYPVIVAADAPPGVYELNLALVQRSRRAYSHGLPLAQLLVW
jgi:hypothetical protein